MTSPALRSSPAGGLAAYLSDNPEEVYTWVEQGQLRLVGAALKDLRLAADVATLRHTLGGVLEEANNLTGADVTWDSWWKRVQPCLTESSYFSPGDKRNTYKLATGVNVADIPAEPLASRPRPARAAGSSSKKGAGNRKRAAALSEQSEAYAADLKQQRESHAADQKQQRQNHAADLKQQREAYATELKQQRETYAAELERQRENHAADLKQQREAYAADLERKEREAERLRNQLQTLRAEMVAGRQKSNLEVRSGMLLRIGDIIQGTYHLEKSSEARLADVMQRLPMVLNDGDAELFGKVGDAVPYDPKFHHSPETVVAGSPVRLVAPGVIASGGSAGAPVLLKAKVTQKTGDN